MEPSLTTDRIAALEHRVAITELLHAYCRFVDLLATHELVELFTEDCVIDYGPGLGGPILGREALEAALARGLRRFAATSHHVSNVEITVQGDVASAICYVLAWHKMTDGSPDACLFGQYHDRFVRTDGSWKVAERRLLVAGETGFPVAWNFIGRDKTTWPARAAESDVPLPPGRSRPT